MSVTADISPRQEVYDTYWRFAAERQSIFMKRLRQEMPPWTKDPILRDFKFCNTFRASDRVSQFLIRNVIYQPSTTDLTERDIVLRVLLFRVFNRIETWKFLEANFGPITLDSFDTTALGDALQKRHHRGNRIFGAAFILCAHKTFGYDAKHRNFLALLDKMLQDKLDVEILRANSLKTVYNLLLEYPLLGKFMAYQLAIDLNYTDILSFSENDFTVAGPGAERGIQKCFRDVGGRNGSEIIHWMVDHQEEEFQRLGIQFDGLFGRRLHAIDCQGLFCEVDKYSRVAFPGLTSNRKRIKVRFKPTSKPIDYFYPPKWDINEQIPKVKPAQQQTERQVSLPL